MELKFNRGLCERCGTYDCLTKCQYLRLDREGARREMMKLVSGEDSFVLRECVTCYACEEYCKRGNHPFYLITELQEKKGILPAPKPILKQWINTGIPTRREPQYFPFAREPVVSLCLFPEFAEEPEREAV